MAISAHPADLLARRRRAQIKVSSAADISAALPSLKPGDTL